MSTDTIEATPSTDAVLKPDESGRFKQRWADIQVHFVDDPEASVREADTLVGEIIDRLETRLREERAALSSRRETNGEVSTEDRRVLTRAYRDLFGRLLDVRM